MNRSRRTLGTLMAAASLCASPTLADDRSPFMASIAIERAPGATAALTGSLASTLHVGNPDKTATLLSRVRGVEIVDRGEDSIRVRFAAQPIIDLPTEERFLESSWIVDFEDDAVRALTGELAASGRSRPTPADLARFVFDHIDDKTYSRSFDFASRVAAKGEGDCTEHAVLLAALARGQGYFARIVFGNVIVDIDEGLFAYGHAWTEVHDGKTWQIHDATMAGREAPPASVRYLPIGILEDEGPAYALSMFELVDAMPARISGVGGSPR